MPPKALLALIFSVFLFVNLPWSSTGMLSSVGIKINPLRSLSQQPTSSSNNTKPVQHANKPNLINRVAHRVAKNSQSFFRGTLGALGQIHDSVEVTYRQKVLGLNSISFEEFNAVDRTKSDTFKFINKLLFAPFGRTVFFISNIAVPLVSSNSLEAFQQFPSTFLSPAEQTASKEILNKKRIQATMQALYQLQNGQTYFDVGKNAINAEHSMLVETALSQPSVTRALEVLEPWLVSKSAHAEKLKIRLPSALVQQCLQAIGISSAPNFPVLRMYNTLNLKKRLGYIRQSDEFIAKKGLQMLSAREVKLACFERCITTENRTESALRKDLSEWLQLVRPPSAVLADLAVAAETETVAPVPVTLDHTVVDSSELTVSGAASTAHDTIDFAPTMMSWKHSSVLAGIKSRIGSFINGRAPSNEATDLHSIAKESVLTSGTSNDTASPTLVAQLDQEVPHEDNGEQVLGAVPEIVADLATTPLSPTPTSPRRLTAMPLFLLSEVGSTMQKFSHVASPAARTFAQAMPPIVQNFTAELTQATQSYLAEQKHIVKSWYEKWRDRNNLVPNLQNRRLAMMGLHAVKQLRTSPFGGVYRAAAMTQAGQGAEHEREEE